MHGTRARVLELIIHRREARVEEIAGELRVTPAAIRRHLDNLRTDGLVDVRQVKQATGRPYHAYHPTEAAAGAMPAGYADLLERMLRGLGEQQTVSTSVMTSVAESLASRHRGEVSEADTAAPEVRVVQVTESLRQDGILDGWREEADGFHLLNGACPYRKAAEISKLPCESDRKAIELLLGMEVEQLETIVSGSPICEYLVHAVRGPQELVEVS
ncbi:MAG: helix-turn-helix transcriptional regulator [Tepidiformaceae bacterium]